MTHHHKIEDREYLLVGIPNNYVESEIVANKLIMDCCYLAWSGNPPEPSHDEWHSEEVELPPGTWQLVGTSDALREEQAAQVVGSHLLLPHAYYSFNSNQILYTALQSFKTLLRSLSLTRCAILQRVR